MKFLKFKAGDKVVCINPIHNLLPDAIYEVIASRLSQVTGLEDNEFVTLKEFSAIPYLAFRFKHYEYHSDDYNISAAIHSVSVDEVVKPTNYVDEGLVVQAASKNDKEKVDLSLIPRISNTEHAKAFMVGERKYSRYNYCKGHKASQLVAAAKRHLDAWFEGEERDPADGQHHLGSVMACCSMILRQQELNTLKDDRYVGDKK